MNRAYWYGLILFIIAFFLQFIPYLLPALLTGVGLDIWAGDFFIFGIYAGLSAFGDQILNNLLMPVLIIIGGLLGALLLVPLYLGVHRLIYKRSRNYAFINHEVQPSLGRWLRRGILPTLFAVYVSITLANIMVDTLGLDFLTSVFASSIDPFVEDVITLKIMLWGFTGLIAVFICCALVVPTWFLDDAGLLTSNVRIENPLEADPNQLPNISGVGSWLARLLKGYAGIAVILLYITMLTESIILSWQYFLLFGFAELPYLIVNLLMFPLYPVIILFLCLPLLMILDYGVQLRKRFVLRIGEWMGIEKQIDAES
ncbi:MAG: hypothetical protein ACFFCH_06725 [Promethearchaeota archaeon]